MIKSHYKLDILNVNNLVEGYVHEQYTVIPVSLISLMMVLQIIRLIRVAKTEKYII